MKTFLTFCVLLSIKTVAQIFYSIEISWVGNERPFGGTKLIVLLNHTSLFEPIYLSVLPIGLLWKIAKSGVLPGADITMNRPIAGWFLRLITSETVPISRRLDNTWKNFLGRIERDSIVIIAAEGRMKRTNGLDKNGNPMTVRGGVSDLFGRIENGSMLIAYSGGLHHVLSPNQKFPRVFKRIRLALEILDISVYKSLVEVPGNPRMTRLAVVRDLERRRDLNCPTFEPYKSENISTEMTFSP